MTNFFLGFVLGVIQIGISLGYNCVNYNYASTYHYCEHGCCDDWPYETCCTGKEVWLGWAIAGGVIGGIILISLAVCIVCVFMKQKGKTGRVILPQQETGQVQPQIYSSHVPFMTAYPQSQGYYPQYTTTVAQNLNPTAPPAYQTLYGQHHQPLPPLPSGLHSGGNNQIV